MGAKKKRAGTSTVKSGRNDNACPGPAQRGRGGTNRAARPEAKGPQAKPARELFHVDYTHNMTEWRDSTIAAPADCAEGDLAEAIAVILTGDQSNFHVADVEMRALDAEEIAQFDLAHDCADFIVTRDEQGRLIREEPSVSRGDTP
jgi:hypothetical protein